MEKWDIYDINRTKTGKTHIRGDRMEDGDYHIVIHICLFNSEGKMLLQKRRDTKKEWSGKWDITASGSALSGETSRQAAARELTEELGIDIDFSHIAPSFSVTFLHGFDDFYIVYAVVDLSRVKMQEEEVQQVKWADREEIHRLISDGEFIPYHRSVIDMIYSMKDFYGCHSEFKADR